MVELLSSKAVGPQVVPPRQANFTSPCCVDSLALKEAPLVSQFQIILNDFSFSFEQDKHALTKLGFVTFLIQQDKGLQKTSQQV